MSPVLKKSVIVLEMAYQTHAPTAGGQLYRAIKHINECSVCLKILSSKKKNKTGILEQILSKSVKK